MLITCVSGCKGVTNEALERVIALSGPVLEWVDVRGAVFDVRVGMLTAGWSGCSEIKGNALSALAACPRLRILKCSLADDFTPVRVYQRASTGRAHALL